MIKTFTKTDLIRYIYQETTEEEKREIEKALICDAELMSHFKEVTATLHELDEATMQPSPATVMNILSYSKSTRTERP